MVLGSDALVRLASDHLGVDRQHFIVGVSATGACAGNTAQICDNGVLKSFDCGANGCAAYVFEGVPVNFCNLCPPNATFEDHPDGGGSCACNQGFKVDSTGTKCVDAAAVGACLGCWRPSASVSGSGGRDESVRGVGDARGYLHGGSGQLAGERCARERSG